MSKYPGIYCMSVKRKHNYIALGYTLPCIYRGARSSQLQGNVCTCMMPSDQPSYCWAWSQGSLTVSRLTPIRLCFCCSAVDVSCMFIIKTLKTVRSICMGVPNLTGGGVPNLRTFRAGGTKISVDLGPGIPNSTKIWGRGSPILRRFGDRGP